MNEITAILEKSNEQAKEIADVQSQLDHRAIKINRVGIKNILHPIKIQQKNGTFQSTQARCDLMVSLASHLKGTHMSRFVEILHEQKKPLSIHGVAEILQTMKRRLKTEDAFIQLHFPFFLLKKAPLSEVESYLNYDVCYFGRLTPEGCKLGMEIIVPVTSLCPCSKEISDYGAHNQRSHVSLKIHIDSLVWVEEMIDLVEKEASCQLYGLLKRVDEKYVTEKAYDNPKFVEDLVRDLAAHLQQDPRITAYTITSENFESIHNHSAFAEISSPTAN